MDIKLKIAQRIKELREQRGLTQEALAYKSDVDRTYMNHVEKGKRNISIINLEKIIVNGLEVSLLEFFNVKVFENGK
ncbi:helix-turn-helix domain-containing protein [Pedobacter cryophilus]|uniref:Helix-turn-helix transcriptional regulator n=1 Tax=Pedobacter cryophilus TaxID=2571271 RepID=A0A4U1C8W1_9SPHI|nr:helix-turn-helix transcriptional regulator [Pedobacter cryophilus]TKC00857.1 helix-turn-helix transcriptional regulator [Pedobacter cryophilus]